MSDVVVLGSGFAGLWAALGAARRLDELGVAHGGVKVTVLSSQPYHDIRVRNYEADLTPCRIPLRDVLDPAGVGHIAADVTAIDPISHTVTTAVGAHGYDRLVIALGSQVVKPDIPGLREFGFDVDTYDGAMRGHCRCGGRRTDRHRDRLRAAGSADDALPRHRDPGRTRRPQPARRLGHG